MINLINDDSALRITEVSYQTILTLLPNLSEGTTVRITREPAQATAFSILRSLSFTSDGRQILNRMDEAQENRPVVLPSTAFGG